MQKIQSKSAEDKANISIRQQLKAVNYDTSKFLEALTLSSAYDNSSSLSPEKLYQILSDSVLSLSAAQVLLRLGYVLAYLPLCLLAMLLALIIYLDK